MNKLILGLVLISNVAFADTINQKDVNRLQHIKEMISSIQGMYTFGIGAHFKYDLMSGSKQCVERSGHYRDKGKLLMKEATQIDMAFRVDMSLAADAAFRCVYCEANTLESCLQIPPLLTSLQIKLQDEWMRLKYGEGKPLPTIKWP